MRMFCLFTTLIVALAFGILALENRGDVEFRFLTRSVSIPHFALFAALFVGGMVTGWTALGFLRRTLRSDTARS